MSVKEKTYWEICIEVNPACKDVLCDIIQTEFDCSGIITSEEKYKNLELAETTENFLKAYISADILDEEEVKNFFKQKKTELIEKEIFNCGLGSWNVTVNKQKNEDWSKKWKEHWKPSKISEKIVICPSWEKYVKKQGEIVVTIDPANAFGTGTHATTQLCVCACEQYMPENACAADIGCGSGILSICAMKLGAKSVSSADIDETVIETAKNNAKINNENSIIFYNASSDILENDKYDFVFANILHDVLIELMPDIKRIMKRGAMAVLSGILDGKETQVAEAACKNNLKIIEKKHRKEWIAFVIKKED